MYFKSIMDLNDTEGAPCRYEDAGGHIRMGNHNVPLSIMEKEYQYIQKLITDHNLQQGYEVATAFGVSALAAGKAFKITGGKLASMDCYIEEQSITAGDYETNVDRLSVKDADGLKSAWFLAKSFNIENHVEFAIGWSPNDTATIIHNVFGNTPQIDYVFIDGGHFEHQIFADIEAVKPFLAPIAFILFHDVWEQFFTRQLQMKIAESLGSDIEIVLPYPEGENLGLLKYVR